MLEKWSDAYCLPFHEDTSAHSRHTQTQLYSDNVAGPAPKVLVQSPRKSLSTQLAFFEGRNNVSRQQELFVNQIHSFWCINANAYKKVQSDSLQFQKTFTKDFAPQLSTLE